MCARCPIKWSGEDGSCCERGGEYDIFSDMFMDYYFYVKDSQQLDEKFKQHLERRIVKLAYRIATLPERECNV